MNKRLVILVTLFLTLSICGSGLAENAKKHGPKRSAPNSGDGIPDGSGFVI